MPKKLYFHTQFEKHEGHGTKTWYSVDNALNRKALKTTPDVISIDNHLCTSKSKIADEFNNYFETILPTIKLPTFPPLTPIILTMPLNRLLILN